MLVVCAKQWILAPLFIPKVLQIWLIKSMLWRLVYFIILFFNKLWNLKEWHIGPNTTSLCFFLHCCPNPNNNFPASCIRKHTSRRRNEWRSPALASSLFPNREIIFFNPWTSFYPMTPPTIKFVLEMRQTELH